ncbi:unnamed protein product, partial [Rotaria sp. Silwood2]
STTQKVSNNRPSTTPQVSNRIRCKQSSPIDSHNHGQHSLANYQKQVSHKAKYTQTVFNESDSYDHHLAIDLNVRQK